jgi:capsular exopolysaccharide synthesis family protein
VDFVPVRESEVIRIVARSSSPDEAALIANTVAQQYVERNVDASRTQSRAVREFLQSQMGAKRQSLDTAESAVQRYMRRSGIASLDAEASKVVEQLSQLEARRDAIDLERSTKTRNLASYKEQLAQLEPNVARSIGQSYDSYIRLLQEQLARLEVQRDVVVGQVQSAADQGLYADKLKEIDGDIARIRKNLETRTKAYMQSMGPGEGSTQEGSVGFLGQVKQKVVEAQIELDGLAAQRQALEGVLQEYEERFNQIPKKSMDLAKLQRDRLSNEKLYLMIEEKYSEALIKEKSEFGYVSIIDQAVEPFGPVSPNRSRNVMLGLIAGLVLGVGAAFVRTYAAAKVRTPEDVKKCGFTPLGTIGRLDEERKKIVRDPAFHQNGRLSSRLVAHHRPLSPISESYRHLRTNLHYIQPDAPLRCLLVTSANPQEGKSTTAANLAISFAQADQRVLLIDADMRRPSVERMFNLKSSRGLSEILTGRFPVDASIRRNIIEGLDVIPCGTIPSNPAELLGSKAMKALLPALKEHYDMIVLDSPPLFAVTDAAVLATEADGVIVVAAAGETRADVLRDAVEFVQGVHGKMLGIVLNNFDVHAAYGRNVKKYHYGYYNYESGYYREEKKIRSKTEPQAR